MEHDAEMEQFYTRDKANDGIRFPIPNPITGMESAHWLHVQGQDSDAFRAEEEASRGRIQKAIAALPSDQRNAAKIAEILRSTKVEERLLGIASTVSAWSFARPCTRENVIVFLRNAPQIMDAIDMVVGERSLFLGSAANSSTDTQNQNSTSPSPSKDPPQVKPSESP